MMIWYDFDNFKIMIIYFWDYYAIFLVISMQWVLIIYLWFVYLFNIVIN